MKSVWWILTPTMCLCRNSTLTFCILAGEDAAQIKDDSDSSKVKPPG